MILTESNGGTRLSSTRYVHYGTITARGESLINKDPRSSLMNIFQSKLVTGLVSLPHSSLCLPSKMKSIGNGLGIRLHKRKRTISGRAWFVSISSITFSDTRTYLSLAATTSGGATEKGLTDTSNNYHEYTVRRRLTLPPSSSLTHTSDRLAKRCPQLPNRRPERPYAQSFRYCERRCQSIS